MADRRFKQPTRVVVVNDDGIAAVKDNVTAAAVAAAAAAAAAAVATGWVEGDIVESVPKSLKSKALHLMDRLQKDPAIQWNDKGELMQEGVAVPGSNIVELFHDILRKRKTLTPTGWQRFARQLRRINLPMEWVANIDRRQYMQQSSSPGWSSHARRRATRSPTSGSRRLFPSLWESF